MLDACPNDAWLAPGRKVSNAFEPQIERDAQYQLESIGDVIGSAIVKLADKPKRQMKLILACPPHVTKTPHEWREGVLDLFRHFKRDEQTRHLKLPR